MLNQWVAFFQAHLVVIINEDLYFRKSYYIIRFQRWSDIGKSAHHCDGNCWLGGGWSGTEEGREGRLDRTQAQEAISPPHLYTSTLPHFHTSTLPHFHSSKLLHFHISTIQHFHISIIPYFHTYTLPHFRTSTLLYFHTSTLTYFHASIPPHL